MKTIDVRIARQKGDDGKILSAVAVFEFETAIQLNLSSSKNEDTKVFFENLLRKTLNSDDDFSFSLQDEATDLFHDVLSGYLPLLEKELMAARGEFAKAQVSRVNNA